jgi:hypothetical protein
VSHERRDVDLRRVLRAGAGVLALLLFALGFVWGLWGTLERRRAARDQPVSRLAERLGRRTPPAPRLQAQPIDDLRALRAWEDERLEAWAWVDREAGLARIPIERAMALLAREPNASPNASGDGE